MHVSFRVDSEFESLMRELAKRGIRTKWLNEAVAQYASIEFSLEAERYDNNEVIKRLDELKDLLLHHLEQSVVKNKETKKVEPEEHSAFFNILSTGINQSL